MNWAIGVMCTLVATSSVIDHSFRIVTAWRTAHSTPVELLAAVEGRSTSTDWLLVVPVAILLLSLMPVVIVSVARRLSADPALERVRLIRGLWEVLVSAFPSIRLNRAEVLSAPEEELHRHLIEIEDALLLLTQWMTDEELEVAGEEGHFQAVEAALRRYEEGLERLRTPVVLPWTTDEGALLALANRVDQTWERYVAP